MSDPIISDVTASVQRHVAEEHFRLIGEVRALRAELASYRELPLVPKAALDRAHEQRDAYAQQLDAMTRTMANLQDSRANIAAQETMRHLVAVLRTLRKSAGGPEDVSVWNAARSHVAESGHRAPEQEEYAQAYAEMESRRAR
jgi:hypothetical protein